MLLVSSYKPARGCVAAQCSSSQYPQFDPCSPQSLQQLSGRASDQITEGRGFISHLGLGLFLSLRVSQNLHNIMLLFLCQYEKKRQTESICPRENKGTPYDLSICSPGLQLYFSAGLNVYVSIYRGPRPHVAKRQMKSNGSSDFSRRRSIPKNCK